MIISDENLGEGLGYVYRFSERRWAEQFIGGHFNFSCAGAYIEQAQKEGNNEQGDRYEAVFARLKKIDKRIQSLKQQLQSDLEIIDDGEYVLLRRHSAKQIPIFCFFVYKIRDLQQGVIGEPYGDNKDLIDVKLQFDDRMISGFSNSKKKRNEDYESELVVASINIEPFVNTVAEFINSSFGILNNAKMGIIDYEKQSNETFFIEPTGEYNELMYKRDWYSYQHEGRIVLRNCRFSNIHYRLDLITKGYEKNKVRIDEEIFESIFKCHIAKNKECL